jgi:hypothetical protein
MEADKLLASAAFGESRDNVAMMVGLEDISEDIFFRRVWFAVFSFGVGIGVETERDDVGLTNLVILPPSTLLDLNLPLNLNLNLIINSVPFPANSPPLPSTPVFSTRWLYRS